MMPSSTSRPESKDVNHDPATKIKLPATSCLSSLAPEQHQPLQHLARTSEMRLEDDDMWSASTIAALQIGRDPARNNKSEDDIINRNIVPPELQEGPQQPSHYDRGADQNKKQAGAELSATKTLILKTEGGLETPFNKINQTVATLAATIPSNEAQAENKLAGAELRGTITTIMKPGGGLGTSLNKTARKLATQATTTTLDKTKAQKTCPRLALLSLTTTKVTTIATIQLARLQGFKQG